MRHRRDTFQQFKRFVMDVINGKHHVCPEPATDGFVELLLGKAMQNRVALNRESLFLYGEMLEVGVKESPEKAGHLAGKLVGLLAAQSGKPQPKSGEEAVEFLRNELKGFDSEEATEHAAQAWLDTAKDIMLRAVEEK